MLREFYITINRSKRKKLSEEMLGVFNGKSIDRHRKDRDRERKTRSSLSTSVEPERFPCPFAKIVVIYDHTCSQAIRSADIAWSRPLFVEIFTSL